jgi:hypothetical protein
MRLDCSPCTVQTQNVCLGYCDLLRQVATLCSTLKSWVNILSSRYLLIYSRPVPRIEPPTRFIDYTATLLRLHTFTQLSRIIFRTSWTPLSRVLGNPIIAQPVNKFPVLYGKWNFIIVFTVTIPWGRWIHFIISHLTCLHPF